MKNMFKLGCLLLSALIGMDALSFDEGYQMSPSEIRELGLRNAEVQVPAGEECLIGNVLAIFDGYQYKVNATCRRITLTGIVSSGWLSGDEYSTTSIPYDSILAYRKTGMVPLYQNSICLVEKNRRAHLLEFETGAIDIGFSGIKLASTCLLEAVGKNVVFATCPGYGKEWQFNCRVFRGLGPEVFKKMPIGVRIKDSKIPFGGYVVCVVNLLDNDVSVNVEVGEKKNSAVVEAGKEKGFGLIELGKRLKEDDIITITTSASDETTLKVKVLKDGDFECDDQSLPADDKSATVDDKSKTADDKSQKAANALKLSSQIKMPANQLRNGGK